ncbi:DUF58 domain-containing protein [Stutzerimonas nitrititolerans]|uniref:DUF58 domain-containing protein n=1 Tax=Stutzerimonas nitrititolerans TaxID=2482751 RepID=UPI00289B9BAB|nr:DUF58 domain-containing protein [Stutzerimonas nitrititolerans]
MNPSRRLLAALAVLFALALVIGVLSALALPPQALLANLWWGLLLSLALLALFDAIRLHRSPSPHLQRSLPGNLPLGRWSDVRLRVQNDLRQPLILEVFDQVPAGLTFEQLPQRLRLSPAEYGEIGYRLKAIRRGRYEFNHCEVRLSSPLGLWRSRRIIPLHAQTRVYPDFTRLHGAPLMAVDNWLSRLGVRQQPRRGLGMEFHQLREYREGDVLRQIDWKATARKRMPITREYQDERDQQILLMLDCGRHMRSQDGELAHFDHALNASLLLAYVALRQGDALGVYGFAAAQPCFVAPAKGQQQLPRLLNNVYDLETTLQPVDFHAVASDVLARQKRRALLVLLSNLRDDDGEFLEAVQRLSRQHRVLVVSLREGILDRLCQRKIGSFDDALAYLGTRDYLGARSQLHQRLLSHGVAVLDVPPHELGPQLISRYLAWKKAGTL